MPETPPTAEELDHQTIERIRQLRHPDYGLIPESPYMPISRIHAESLENLEFEARSRNLKI